MDSKTTLYSIEDFDNGLVESILNEVSTSLKEKGYNPVSQLVGYLMSGDSGYISSYQGARNKVISINRGKILEFLLKNYLGDKK